MVFCQADELSVPSVVFAKATWCGSSRGALPSSSRNNAEFSDGAAVKADEHETRKVLLFNIGRQT